MTEKEIMNEAYLDVCANWEKVCDLLHKSDNLLRVEMCRNTILREEFEVAEQKKSVLFEEWERCPED